MTNHSSSTIQIKYMQIPDGEALTDSEPTANPHDCPRLAFRGEEDPETPCKLCQNIMVKRLRQCIDWREVKLQCSLAGPLIIGNLLSFCLLLISIAFVGHFGELELSGASIASSFAVVTGYSLVLGMGYALETLCGQAYGAGQYRKLGIYLQRAIFVLNIMAIPLAILWANIEMILRALGQDPEIASIAGSYGVWLIPTLFATATAQPLTKFLQAQSLVAPILFIALGTLLCHLPVCWYMVSKSGMGYRGAAVANSISYWVNAVLLSLYVRFSHSCEKCRASLSWEALHDLKNFFELAIPSAAMIWCVFSTMPCRFSVHELFNIPRIAFSLKLSLILVCRFDWFFSLLVDINIE